MYRKFHLFYLLCLIFLAACGSVYTIKELTNPVEPTKTPSPTISTAQLEIQALWRRGPHSKVLIRAEDVDYSCAKCHSPDEWDPNRVPERAPDCATAVVNTTIGTSRPSVDLTGWHAVECKICHQPLENGEFFAEVSFWNPETGKYEAVLSSTDLCSRCHRKSEGIDNGIDLGTGIHTNLGCTDCHEPHRATASCANSTCHNKVAAVSGFLAK